MPCPLCNKTSFSEVGTKNSYKIVSCNSCDFIFVDPMPKTCQLEDLYIDYSHTKSYLKKLKKKVFTSKFKLKRIRKYLQIKNISFLDVGCSVGATVEAARSLGYSALGIDLDSSVLKQSKKTFPLCQFKSMTTNELVDTNEKYDLIYCAEVIEHVPDPHDFVLSLSKLLKPSAILYLTTPNAGHWKVPKEFVLWNRVTPPEHIGYFTKKTMKKLLETYGLEVIKFYRSHRANMRVVCRKI